MLSANSELQLENVKNRRRNTIVTQIICASGHERVELNMIRSVSASSRTCHVITLPVCVDIDGLLGSNLHYDACDEPASQR